MFGALAQLGCASTPATSSPDPASGPAPGGTTKGTPTPAPTTPAPGPTTRSGVLLFATDAAIAGVDYVAGAQHGTTDGKGTFTYEAGATVSFAIGAQALGTATGADVLSPYQLAGATTCDDTDAVKSLVALLESVDADHDSSNGISVPAGATKPATLPDAATALHAFITAFDGETWSDGNVETFQTFDALVRGQGVASDGSSWFFSGNTGLEHTDPVFASTKKNTLAIPIVLAAQGSDHIGDIDVYNGTIFAPIEDKKLAIPKVVLFDATSLAAGTIFDIPVNLQTGGVPWIAVDGPRGVAYLAEWDPTPSINVFSLATMTYTHSIPLSAPIGRIQGGKVHRGQLYLTSDDAAKHVYKVHLASGTVFPLFHLAVTDVELEGLTFFARPDGSLLHTLDVLSSRTGVELRHHSITREPLRWKVCP